MGGIFAWKFAVNGEFGGMYWESTFERYWRRVEEEVGGV